jgi:prephenate dehydratase
MLQMKNRIPELKVKSKSIIFGIQGGKGSFNDTAIRDYVTRHNITKYKVKYLYTTEKVLSALHKGVIDFGLFAIHNSVGGVVKESLTAISKYNFNIVEEFAILIRHNLMKRRDVNSKDIRIVMAHDQVLKQCTQTLMDKYSYLKQVTGTGDLIDTATAAKALSEGELEKEIFILGNPIIAELFDFDTVAENLQDSKNNLTSFLLVEK